jgi:hypothetical protein
MDQPRSLEVLWRLVGRQAEEGVLTDPLPFSQLLQLSRLAEVEILTP